MPAADRSPNERARLISLSAVTRAESRSASDPKHCCYRRVAMAGRPDSPRRTHVKPVIRHVSTNEALLTSEAVTKPLRVVASKKEDEMHFTEFVNKHQEEATAATGTFGDGGADVVYDRLVKQQAVERARLNPSSLASPEEAESVLDVDVMTWVTSDGGYSSFEDSPEKVVDNTARKLASMYDPTDPELKRANGSNEYVEYVDGMSSEVLRLRIGFDAMKMRTPRHERSDDAANERSPSPSPERSQQQQQQQQQQRQQQQQQQQRRQQPNPPKNQQHERGKSAPPARGGNSKINAPQVGLTTNAPSASARQRQLPERKGVASSGQTRPKHISPSRTSPGSDSPSRRKKRKQLPPGPMLQYYQQHNKSPPRELPKHIFKSSTSRDKQKRTGTEGRNQASEPLPEIAEPEVEEDGGAEGDLEEYEEEYDDDDEEEEEEEVQETSAAVPSERPPGDLGPAIEPATPAPAAATAARRPEQSPRSKPRQHAHRSVNGPSGADTKSEHSGMASAAGAMATRGDERRPSVGRRQDVARSGDEAANVRRRVHHGRAGSARRKGAPADRTRSAGAPGRKKAAVAASRRPSWDSQPHKEPALFEKGGARYKYNSRKRLYPKKFPPPPPKSESSWGDVEDSEEDAKAGDYFEASLQHWKLGTVYYRDTIPQELEVLYKKDMHIVQAVGAANSRWGKPWGL